MSISDKQKAYNKKYANSLKGKNSRYKHLKNNPEEFIGFSKYLTFHKIFTINEIPPEILNTIKKVGIIKGAYI